MEIKDRVVELTETVTNSIKNVPSSIKNIDLKNELRHAVDGVNIPVYERIATTALGLAAIYFGTRNRGVIGWTLAAAGSGLAARGISGHCPAYRKLLSDRADADGQSSGDYGLGSSKYSGNLGTSARPQV